MRIGIVGGGIAGLTAAYRLVKAGHQVFVFESDEKLGGLARSFDFAGTQLDVFYRHIFKSDTDIVKLIDELKLNDELLWNESKMGFYTEGKTYNFTTPVDLLMFKPLPFIDRIKLGLLALYLQRVNKWKKYEKITVKEWMDKYLGGKVYEKVWGPLLKQKFGALADTISMTWLYGRIHSRVASREKGGVKEVLGYMKGSYQALIDTLETEIQKEGGRILKKTSVSKVNTENGKVKSICVQGEEHAVDAAILTCAPALAVKLADFDGAYKERLKKLKYNGAMALVMRLKRSLSKIYWLSVAEPDSPFVAVIEHTNLIPKEVYGGDNIVYIAKYLPVDDKMYSMKSEEIKDIFFAYLKKIYPDFSESDVIEYRISREPFSQPIVQKGFSEIKLDYASPVKGLYMANMSMIYPEDRGMSYSVRLGNEVSAVILDQKES